jgi:hypothetical protein
LFNVHNPAQFLRSSLGEVVGRDYRFYRGSVSNLGVYDLRDRPIDNEVTFQVSPATAIRHKTLANSQIVELAVTEITDFSVIHGHTRFPLPRNCSASRLRKHANAL